MQERTQPETLYRTILNPHMQLSRTSKPLKSIQHESHDVVRWLTKGAKRCNSPYFRDPDGAL
eukprot:776130-Amphidinium_carterae.1